MEDAEIESIISIEYVEEDLLSDHHRDLEDVLEVSEIDIIVL